MLLSEIFSEEHFAATFIWNNEGNIDNQSKIKGNHEFIHCYARNLDKLERPKVIDPNIEETSKLFRSEIENSITKNGPANPPSKILLPAGFPTSFQKGEIKKQTGRYPYLHARVTVSDYKTRNDTTIESGWSSKNLLLLFIKNGFQPIRDSEGKETRFALTDTGAIYGYKHRSEDQGHVLTVIRNVGTTKQNSSMLEKMGISFDWPKPVMLIQYLCQIFSNEKDIILDSFAGSGTTAHAVLNLNKEDSGNRRFILIQCDELKDGKLVNICETLTSERVRRVILGVPKANEESLKKGLGGSFSYFELGKSIELDGILDGKNLPSYTELARYVFYTATGQDFDEKKVDEKKFFIGSTKEHNVYLLYKPDVEFLKGTALTLERARALGPHTGKRRLVFAPTKYLDQDQLAEFHIDFAQLPFEIYRLAK